MKINRPAPFSTNLMRGLLLLVLASLGLSSTTVSALGLEDLRMVLFAVLFLALIGGAILLRPRFGNERQTAPLVALWLLALIGIVSATAGQGGSIIDYKILLPILALLLAPNLRAAVGDLDLARLTVRAGAVYVLASSGIAALVPSAAAFRNVAAHVRIDITGSIVLHASLCTILALAAAAAAVHCQGTARRALLILVAAAAAWMVMLTGTRSALLLLVVFALLWAMAGRLHDLARPRVLGLGLAVLGLFLLLSFMASDTLWSRLTEIARDDYSSGRWPAIRHWLGLAAGHPFGLGLGATRAMLAAGRPSIGGGALLEWPHNELVRFWVEAGPLGLMLVLIVIGEALRRALAHARATAAPIERVLVLAIAADLVVQCLFQNYFNSVYHATVMLMLLGMLAAGRQPAPA